MAALPGSAIGSMPARRPDFDAWLDVEQFTRRTATSSGTIGVPGGRVWWMRMGDGPEPPLLVLHGGPGAGHDGLLPLATLANERPVMFYDQLGCGRSDRPPDPGLYTIQRAIDEVDAVRAALGLKEVDLFGHSWGSILAIELLCQGRGNGVRKLVLSGAIASVPQFAAGTRCLLDAIRRRQVSGADDAQLERLFYERHFCRVVPKPGNLARSADNLKASPAYRLMNGPNEFTVTGVIRDWDRRRDLHRIGIPTLVTAGEHDEVTDDVIDAVVDGIPGARRRVFAGCSHSVLNEAPQVYLSALRNFLNGVESIDDNQA